MPSNIVSNASAAVLQPRVVTLAQTCRRAAAVGIASWFMLGCATQQSGSNSASASGADGAMNASSAIPGGGAQPAQPNTLSDEERRSGFRLLFDGTTLNGWRAYQGDTLPQAWRVASGSITKNVTTRDMVTRDQFGDFELRFDWKVATGGNAGVFYRATEEYDRVYWSAPEYQLLDDPNAADGRNRLTAAGAAYGLYPAPEGIVKPAGEWNTSRIIARGPHVEHWLNGQKLLEYEFWSQDWEAKVKASKFRDWPNYGRAARGHIAFQGDHRGDLELRNIRIREIR